MKCYEFGGFIVAIAHLLDPRDPTFYPNQPKKFHNIVDLGIYVMVAKGCYSNLIYLLICNVSWSP